MIQTKSRTTGGSSWWPFSAGKKVFKKKTNYSSFFSISILQSDITNENAKSDALAQVAKSDVIATILKNQNFIRKNS